MTANERPRVSRRSGAGQRGPASDGVGGFAGAEPPESRTEYRGSILATLPRALYRVALDDGHEITAHAVPGPRRNFVRLVVGDRVVLELTTKDTGRGRITKRIGR